MRENEKVGSAVCERQESLCYDCERNSLWCRFHFTLFMFFFIFSWRELITFTPMIFNGLSASAFMGILGESFNFEETKWMESLQLHYVIIGLKCWASEIAGNYRVGWVRCANLVMNRNWEKHCLNVWCLSVCWCVSCIVCFCAWWLSVCPLVSFVFCQSVCVFLFFVSLFVYQFVYIFTCWCVCLCVCMSLFVRLYVC